MSTHEVFLAVLAREYYEENLSKVALAGRYGISRFQVARLLEEARSRGIVRIEIRAPQAAEDVSPQDLARRLGLERVSIAPPVVPGADPEVDASALRTTLARTAAAELSAAAFEGATIGVSWSRTLAEAATYVTELPQCDLVQLAGALSEASPNASLSFLYRLGTIARSTPSIIWAPLLVEDAATARGLYRQPEIAETLHKADSLDIAAVAFGAWYPGVSTVHDRVDPADQRKAADAGAIGECSGRLFDAEGKAVTVLDDRVMAVSREQLARTPKVIAVAAGATPAPAVVAASKTGIFDTLVVSSELAAVLDANLDDLLEA